MQRKPSSSKKFHGSSLNKTTFEKIADTPSKDVKKADALQGIEFGTSSI